MESYFSSEFFSGNRRRLRELFTGKAPIVITANALLQRNGDVAYPFRQDSNFWYLTGIIEPEIVLVLDKDKEYLIVPERHHIRNIFDGGLDTDLLAKRSGITEIIGAKEGWKRLGSRLKRVSHVATLAAPAPYVEGYEFYTNPARATLTAKLKRYAPDIELLDLREHFARLRMIKQPLELRAIQDSINLTVSALKQLQKKLTQFSFEYEIEAFLSHAYRKKGAQHGYRPIIASGQNAVVLHYDGNDDPLDTSAVLLIDTGAELEYYSADITRTFSLGVPTKRQQNVIQAVQDVQNYALSNLKPGISVRENEKLVEQYMGEKLRALGLIKVIERDEVQKFFSHATSHFLGLDLHDLGDYDAPLQPGMVLTVEPGIYIEKEGLGVRIEDDVLITEKGCKVLSSGLK